MIKKSELKSTFEAAVKGTKKAFFGHQTYSVDSWKVLVEAVSVTKVCVCLFAVHKTSMGDVISCIARSNPLSPASAHQLVCSL